MHFTDEHDAFSSMHSGTRCGIGRNLARRADVPITARRTVMDLKERYIRDFLASIVLLDHHDGASFKLIERSQRFCPEIRIPNSPLQKKKLQFSGGSFKPSRV
jgi:hypothetical protein